MAHKTEHRLEEAHHAEHASHDEFNRTVAMTMAIIAATLAGVTLLSHRAHNHTLLYEIEAAKFRTEAANRWAQFQAKNIRRHEYEAFKRMLPIQAGSDKTEKVNETIAYFDGVLKEYKQDVEEEKDKKDPQGLKGLMEIARELDDKAKETAEQSTHYHHQADRFDLGHLGIEMGLVLASVSILTKRKFFWIAGIVASVVGFGIAMSAFLPVIMKMLHLGTGH